MKDDMFDASGNIGEASRAFLQKWIDRYTAWVKQHSA
jgi:chromate reductase